MKAHSTDAEFEPAGDQVEPTIPVLRPRLPSAEQLLPYLRRIDATRVYTSWGPLALELEERLCRRFSLPLGGVVSAGSGTSALTAAILTVAGRATGGRRLAIVPALTFVATAAAAESCGYTLRIADVDPATWQLDPERVAARADLAEVAIVIPVAPFGRPVQQDPWLEFRERTSIPVVIDGAATFEAAADQREQVLGELPVAMSFHATKAFATGEGGCVASTETGVVEQIGQALNFGFFGSRDSATPSLNGKLSEYHAAVGLAELEGWNARTGGDRARAQPVSGELRQTRPGGPPRLRTRCRLNLCAVPGKDAARSERRRREPRGSRRLVPALVRRRSTDTHLLRWLLSRPAPCDGGACATPARASHCRRSRRRGCGADRSGGRARTWTAVTGGKTGTSVAVMQPYFFPYLGYFQLLAHVVFSEREIVVLCRATSLGEVAARNVDYRTGEPRGSQWSGQLCIFAGVPGST